MRYNVLKVYLIAKNSLRLLGGPFPSQPSLHLVRPVILDSISLSILVVHCDRIWFTLYGHPPIFLKASGIEGGQNALL